MAMAFWKLLLPLQVLLNGILVTEWWFSLISLFTRYIWKLYLCVCLQAWSGLHYRWLWVTMQLLRNELRNSGWAAGGVLTPGPSLQSQSDDFLIVSEELCSLFCSYPSECWSQATRKLHLHIIIKKVACRKQQPVTLLIIKTSGKESLECISSFFRDTSTVLYDHWIICWLWQ